MGTFPWPWRRCYTVPRRRYRKRSWRRFLPLVAWRALLTDPRELLP